MDTLKSAIKAIGDIKAKDIRIYDSRNVTPFFDYVVIATCTTSRQLNAVVDRLKKESQDQNLYIKGVEGLSGGYWVLIDLGTVLVNLFLQEEREKYDLDKLWKDLPQIDPQNYL